MSYLFAARLRATVLMICASCLSTSSVSASEQEEIIVLRNGRIIRGSVTPIGDEVIISFAGGGEMHLPASSVECRCRSLAEAYELKRQRLDPHRVEQRLELAEWCIRHDLLKQAMNELLEAQTQDPGNERIDRVRRQWILASQFQTSPPVVKTTTKEPIGVEELDRLVRELPVGAVEQFTTAIQPILMNSCATSKCHGANSANDLRLIRPASRRILARRFTQRNLFAVLQMLDTESPDKSQLLINAMRPHGLQQKAALGPHDRQQYEQLARWVRSISKKTPPRKPLTIAKRDTRLLQTSSMSQNGFQRSSRTEPRTDPSSPPMKPGKAAPFTTADPFDPEIFNRRFHPQSPRSR